MLRHWSAWSGPPGRLFCKSNRRTALRWSSSAPSTAAAVSLRVSPVPPPTRTPGPLASLASSSPCDVGRRGRHFIFKKRPPSALSFVRSFILGATEGFDSLLRIVAPWPTLLTAREGEKRNGKGRRQKDRERKREKEEKPRAS